MMGDDDPDCCADGHCCCACTTCCDCGQIVRPVPHDKQWLALAAAHQASEATHELIRFAREGEAGFTAFGDVEVIEKLADALKMAIDIDDVGAASNEEERKQLRHALGNYLEGWMG